MKNENDDITAKGGPGMYVKIVDNRTKFPVQVKVKEYQNHSFALDPNETGHPTDFPLPWVSNTNDVGKCTLIEIKEMDIRWKLWDDKGSGAFYDKEWSAEGTKVGGVANTWGDYRLTILEGGSLRMDKIQ